MFVEVKWKAIPNWKTKRRFILLIQEGIVTIEGQCMSYISINFKNSLFKLIAFHFTSTNIYVCIYFQSVLWRMQIVSYLVLMHDLFFRMIFIRCLYTGRWKRLNLSKKYKSFSPAHKHINCQSTLQFNQQKVILIPSTHSRWQTIPNWKTKRRFILLIQEGIVTIEGQFITLIPN
jgi:hypothetical protein